MKYSFIEAHRAEFSIRSMCRARAMRFSGFYAWVQEPLRVDALEDVRQTDLIPKAWTDSNRPIATACLVAPLWPKAGA